MLDTNRTNANNFIISQAVSEAVAYTLGIEGLTLLRTDAGGLNGYNQVYYFSNNILSQLPVKSSDKTLFEVKLIFLRREDLNIEETWNGESLYLYGTEHYVLSQTYVDNQVAATSFFDTLYKSVEHEVLAEFYIYDNVLYLSYEALLVANQQ
jgi:hypothetical protein